MKSISGGPKGEKYAALTFHFEASKSVDNLKVGDIENISKEGWHYLWVEYEDVEDANAKDTAQRPRAVYVERIYEYFDFESLNLPSPW